MIGWGWGLLLVCSVQAALFGLLKLFEKVVHPHPELPRKLMHVAMGLIVISFPWVFAQTWPVLVLAGISAVALAGVKLIPSVRDGVGTVLTGVQRTSLGEVAFPVAVGLLWILSRGDKLLFVVPMLILTLADAVAALVGIVYGKVRYVTSDGFKSAEGSLAFFSIAFLSVHVPLLLCTDIGRAQTLLISAIVGILSTLIEAIAARGLDNLLIPLGAFGFLTLYERATLYGLETRLCVTLILLIFVLCWRRRSTLNDSALIACALFGYGAAMLGGWIWLIGPFALFIIDVAIWPRKGEGRAHDVYTVVSITLPGLLWLGLQVAYGGTTRFYFPYAVGFGAHLAIIGISMIGSKLHALPPRKHLITWVFLGWTMVVVQMIQPFLHGPMTIPSTIITFIAGLACVLVAATIFYLLIPKLYRHIGSAIAIDTAGFTCGLLASLLAVAIHYLTVPRVK